MISTSPVDFSGFKSDKYKYYITVENSVTEIGVSAKGKNGSTYSVSGNKNLQEGTNKITVTAKNGSSTQNYYIYVTRKTANNEEVIPNEIEENKKEDEQKQTLRLDNLVLDDNINVKLDPNFDPETFEYTVILGTDYFDLKELYINALPNIDGAKVTIEGNKDLADIDTIVTIKVEAEGYETVTYTIKVLKQLIEEKIAEPVLVDTEDIIDNSKDIMKKRIIICSLVCLILFIGIIFIAKECYESTNNLKDKKKNKDKANDEEYINSKFEKDKEENNILEDLYKIKNNEIESRFSSSKRRRKQNRK